MEAVRGEGGAVNSLKCVQYVCVYILTLMAFWEARSMILHYDVKGVKDVTPLVRS